MEGKKETDGWILGQGSLNLLGKWCRCGKVHEGAYAQEEWARHQCLHEEQLTGVDVERGRVYPSFLRVNPEVVEWR